MSLNHRERIEVGVDGEEIVVWNWVSVVQPAHVRGHNPVVEKFDATIGAGDMDEPPEAVTEEVAEELYDEFSIDVEDHDIEVIDVHSDEVSVL